MKKVSIAVAVAVIAFLAQCSNAATEHEAQVVECHLLGQMVYVSTSATSLVNTLEGRVVAERTCDTLESRAAYERGLKTFSHGIMDEITLEEKKELVRELADTIESLK